jgi:hypothetical protein
LRIQRVRLLRNWSWVRRLRGLAVRVVNDKVEEVVSGGRSAYTAGVFGKFLRRILSLNELINELEKSLHGRSMPTQATRAIGY